jgi:DNA-binding NarL/FixJ family response regulator
MWRTCVAFAAQATARIRAELPQTQVLVLTTYADDDALFPALQAGARGYLTKNASAEEIEQALSALGRGQTHLAPEVQQRLVAASLDARAAGPGPMLRPMACTRARSRC